MLTVKRGNLEQIDRVSIQAAEIYIITFGMRSRAIEGVNPTVAAKMMFGDPGIEGIGTQCICALQERKSGSWDDEMNETFLGANRAITINCCELFDSDLITNCAAVASTLINHLFGHTITAGGRS
jgi:hypothetical protein